MKFMKYLLITSILLLGALYGQSAIIADTHDSPEAPEFEDDGSHDRDLSVDLTADEIRLEAVLKQGLNQDKFRVEMKVDSAYPDDNNSGEIEIRFKYTQEANSSQVSFQYRIEMVDIIEYVENGTAVGYQEGEEIGTYNIGGTGWADIAHVIEPVVSGNDTDDVHIFTATTLDGVVSIVVRVAGSVVDLGNGTLTPNSVKMDVIINNFPYQGVDSSLAIKSKVKSATELSVEEESAEESLGVSSSEKEIKLVSNGTQGYFSWAETATADGTVVSVIDSPLSDVIESDDDVLPGEDNIKMFFSFNATNANEIVWDPKVGVIANDIVLPAQNTSEPPVSSESTTSSPPATTQTTTSTTQPPVNTDESDEESSPGFGIVSVVLLFSLVGIIPRIKNSRK